MINTRLIILLVCYWILVICLFATNALRFNWLKPVEFDEPILRFFFLLAFPVILIGISKLAPYIKSLKFKWGGTEWDVKFQEMEEKIEKGHKKIEEGHKRIKESHERLHQITNSQESTLHSLASLVISDPLKMPAYKKFVDDRIKSKKTIIIGCQEYTEQRILCAIICKLLKYSAQHDQQCGIQEVIPKYNFGGAPLNFIALLRGDIDIYPGYTWQGLEMAFATSLPQSASDFITSKDEKEDAENVISKLNEIYGQQLNPLKWICHLGFKDNWEIVMRIEDAEKKRIEKVSDLAKWDNKFILGCEHKFFARPSGFNLLKSPEPNGYEILFKDVKFYRHLDVYKALENKEVDIIDGFSTDPQIAERTESIEKPYKVLVDDKNRFGKYYASIVTRKSLLERCPAVEKTLSMLTNKINAFEMGQMIQKADSVKERSLQFDKIEKLAENFLEYNKILPLPYILGDLAPEPWFILNARIL